MADPPRPPPTDDARVFEALEQAAELYAQNATLRDLADLARLVGGGSSEEPATPRHDLNFPLGLTLKTEG